MGIRFRCHLCHTELHVKDHQAGKRGRCPACQGSFRIPLKDADFSLAPEERPQVADRPFVQLQQEESPQLHSAHPTATESSGAHSAAKAAEAQTIPVSVPSSSLPRAIAESLKATWYIRPTSGGQYGPANGQVVWQWLLENRIGADALVWREDWPEWLSASLAFHEYFRGPAPAPDPASNPASAPKIPPVNSPIPNARLPDLPFPNAPSVPSEPSLPSQMATRPASSLQASGPSTGQKNREFRRRRRQRNYLLLVVGLIVVFFLLLAGLIAVLWHQSKKTSMRSQPQLTETLSHWRPSMEIEARVEIGFVQGKGMTIRDDSTELNPTILVFRTNSQMVSKPVGFV